MLTQVGVKQLTDFLRTVTAASDLVDCTLVNCVFVEAKERQLNYAHQTMNFAHYLCVYEIDIALNKMRCSNLEKTLIVKNMLIKAYKIHRDIC